MYAFVYTEKPARVTSPISPPSRKNKIGIITPEGDCPVRLQIGYTNDSVFLMLLFFLSFSLLGQLYVLRLFRTLLG